MTVITISRELGSEGSFIAHEVARSLNYRLVDKDCLENILSQYGFVHFEEDYEASPNFWGRLDESRINMIDALNRVIQAIGWLDNVVIIGRGSFAVLGGFANVLNIRLQAPFPVRVKRILADRGLASQAEAEEVVKESDKVRAAFVQSWYGVRWDTASYFDLVIDTSKISREQAVQWILEAQAGLPKPQDDERPSLKTLQVDPTLLTAVEEELDSQGVI